MYLYSADGSPHPLDRYFPVSSSEVIISSSQTANTLRPFSMVVPKERGRPLSESGGGTSPTRKKPLCVVCMSDAVSCLFFPCKRIFAPFFHFASLMHNRRVHMQYVWPNGFCKKRMPGVPYPNTRNNRYSSMTSSHAIRATSVRTNFVYSVRKYLYICGCLYFYFGLGLLLFFSLYYITIVCNKRFSYSWHV